MTKVAENSAGTISAASLEQQIRAKIDSLSYLPTTVAVAMKFIDLGKNPDAEPAEYAKVISSDSSLSAKLLALVNSSWFAVRNNVAGIPRAVNLLGLGTIRTLATSYCVAGLHNELGLAQDEARPFWEAALCKAVAAKQYAHAINPKLADQCFVAGLFQDFAIPVMYCVAKEELLPILQAPDSDWQTQLQKERTLFRLDHGEIGRILAQKMELPEAFVDAIAFHHNYANLSDFMEEDVIGDAVYVSSLFPHTLDAWNRADAEELSRFLSEHGQSTWSDPNEFLEAVQQEFDQLYRYFEEGNPPETRLAELLTNATREIADDTTHLVTTVNELMQNAANMGMEMNKLVTVHTKLQDKANRDPLTGVLNREGFTNEAGSLLDKAARYGVGLAVVYLDLDKFKSLNDTLGHAFGDFALNEAAARMMEAARQHDVVGRIGGDEFVMLLYDCTQQDAVRLISQLVSAVASSPCRKGKRSVNVTLSAGVFWLQPSKHTPSLDRLIIAVDRLMYQAKRSGGNRVASGTFET